MQGRSPTRGAACRGALHGCRLWGPPKGVWWTSSAVLRFRSVCLQFRVGRERGRVAAHRGCPTQSRNTVGAVQTPDEKGGGVWPGRGRVGAHPGARPPCGSFSRAVQNPDKRGGGVWTGWDRVGAPPQVPGDHAVHLPGRVPGRPRPLAGQPPRQLRAGHILFVPASRRGHDRARARVQHQRARRRRRRARRPARDSGFQALPFTSSVSTCNYMSSQRCVAKPRAGHSTTSIQHAPRVQLASRRGRALVCGRRHRLNELGRGALGAARLGRGGTVGRGRAAGARGRRAARPARRRRRRPLRHLEVLHRQVLVADLARNLRALAARAPGLAESGRCGSCLHVHGVVAETSGLQAAVRRSRVRAWLHLPRPSGHGLRRRGRMCASATAA